MSLFAHIVFSQYSTFFDNPPLAALKFLSPSSNSKLLSKYAYLSFRLVAELSWHRALVPPAATSTTRQMSPGFNDETLVQQLAVRLKISRKKFFCLLCCGGCLLLFTNGWISTMFNRHIHPNIRPYVQTWYQGITNMQNLTLSNYSILDQAGITNIQNLPLPNPTSLNNGPPRALLLYTKLYSAQQKWGIVIEDPNYLKKIGCRIHNCYFTYDKSQLRNASAVIFHFHNIPKAAELWQVTRQQRSAISIGYILVPSLHFIITMVNI